MLETFLGWQFPQTETLSPAFPIFIFCKLCLSILGNLSWEMFLHGDVFYSQLKAFHVSHPYRETFSFLIGKLFSNLLRSFFLCYCIMFPTGKSFSFPLVNCSHSNLKNFSTPMRNIPSENFHFHWEKFNFFFLP